MNPTPDSGTVNRWYEKPLRIAALQCNFEKDSLAVIDKWASMGFNTEQLLHPIADLYSANYNPDRHAALLKRYVEKAHRKGLRIILYLNIHILGPALKNRKDEWAMRDAAGRVVMHYEGTYPSVCLNSPWRETFFRTLENVAGLGVDGIFLDGPAMGREGCFCGHCRKIYRARYGLPRTDPGHQWEFCNETMAGFLSRAHARWHALKPGSPLYHNLPILYAARSFVDMRRALAYNDIIGSEGGFMHYAPARDAFLYKPAFTAKLLEAVAPEKPRVVFMAADHKPWSWWMHTPVETELCIASCAANGANVWYGLHGSTALLRTPSAQAAGGLFRFMKKHERAYAGTRSAARGALVYSYDSDRYHSHSGDESDFTAGEKEKATLRGDMEKSLRGYVRMLTESGVPFDLITDLSPESVDPRRYDWIILPSCGVLPAPFAQALTAYVQKGGLLVAQADASLFGRDRRPLTDFALAALFGAKFKGRFLTHTNWNYFTLDAPLLQKAAGTSRLPLPLLTLDVSARRGTRALARAMKDLPGRYTLLQPASHPMILETPRGKGKCVYIAAAFGEMYDDYHPDEYRSLVLSLLGKRLERGIRLLDNPGTVEIAVREQPGAQIIHLVNYSAGPGRPFKAMVTIRNLEISLPKGFKGRGAMNLRDGKALYYDRTKNALILPELGTYEIVRLPRQ